MNPVNPQRPEIPSPDTWIGVAALAKAERTTSRTVYCEFARGMRHSRTGGWIRVRRADWHRWHEAHVVAGAAETAA